MGEKVMTETVEQERKLHALLTLYSEQCTHGRHTELQRHAVSAMFLTAAGVFISVIGAMKFTLSMAPLACCVILLGFYARRFVREYENKWDQAGMRRNRYRADIEKLIYPPPSPEGQGQNQPAADGSKKTHTLRGYWRNTFTAVVVAGAVCLLIIVVKSIADGSAAFWLHVAGGWFCR
jgi:hypothetical protein